MIYKLVCVFGILFPLTIFAQSNTEEIDRLILNSEYDQALIIIDEQLEVEPSAALFFKKGQVFEKQMKYSQAIQSLNVACETDSLQALYWQELADAHNSLGEYTDAVLYFERALQIDSLNTVLKGKLAHTYINLKSYPEAFKHYKEIYIQDSTNVYFNRYYAYVAYQTEQYDLAIKLYNELMQLGSRDLTTYTNLATIHAIQDDLGGALGACFRGLEQFPGNTTLNLKLAGVFFNSKKYDAAFYYYKEVLKTGSLDYKNSLQYGVSLYFCEQEEEALDVLFGLYNIQVNDPVLTFYIGACYKNMGMYDESIDYFKSAISSAYHENISDFYHHLAQVYKWKGEFGNAIESYKKALEYDPAMVEMLFQIALIYDESQVDKYSALDYYQSYLDEAEDDTNKEFVLGRIQKLKEDLFFE